METIFLHYEEILDLKNFFGGIPLHSCKKITFLHSNFWHDAKIDFHNFFTLFTPRKKSPNQLYTIKISVHNSKKNS